MITAEFTQNREKQFTGFKLTGHAEYADPGYDIICAAASMLSINTANSIEKLTGAPVISEAGEEGFMSCQIQDPEDPEAQLLVRSLKLGLETIRDTYGRQYVTVSLKSAPF